MTRTTMTLLLVLALFGLAGPATRAQTEPDRSAAATGNGPAELRAAMRDYFQKRLRTELSLSDKQVEHILPRMTAMEDARRESQRSRADAVRQLRRGLEQGAPDGDLERQLDRLDRVEREQWERQRELLKEIDTELSARQRVQMRFFIQSFRREMQDKIFELRGERARGRDRRPSRRRGSARDTP